MLRSPIGAANGALVVQQVVDHLLRVYADRLHYSDHTKVDHIGLHEHHAEVHAHGRTVHTDRVVLCTNGFLDHVLENFAGESLDSTTHHHLIGTKGYMAGVLEPGTSGPDAYSFIRNETIGDDELPYLYVTRRPWAHDQTLVVFGGPEEELDDAEPTTRAPGSPPRCSPSSTRTCCRSRTPPASRPPRSTTAGTD